jgi:hypothetical protein
MNYFKLLYLSAAFVLVFSSCSKDDDEKTKSPLEINYNVNPNNFLSADKYNQLVIEVQYVPGMQPNAATLTRLQTFLGNRLNKPNGISIVQKEIASPGKAQYTLEDIVSIEKALRTQNTGGQTLTAYIVFVDGAYIDDKTDIKTLGVAYYPSSMVIFENTIRGLSGHIGQPSTLSLESTVSQHEFGHILGLVNNGTPLQSLHQDEPNGKHCNNENCLMYYEAETSKGISRVNGVPDLDAACLADLKANGGK